MLKKLKILLKQVIYRIVALLPFNMLRIMANRKLLVINYHSILGIDCDPLINKNVYRTQVEFEQDLIFLKKRYSFVSLQEVLAYKLKGQPLNKNSVLLTFDDGLRVVYDIIRPILLKHDISAAFFINPNFIDNNDLHYQRKKNLIQETISVEEADAKQNSWKQLFAKYGIDYEDFYRGINSVNFQGTALLNDVIALFEIDLPHYLKRNRIYLESHQIEEMIKEGFYFGGHSMDHPKYDELSLQDQVVQTQDSVKWVKDKFDLPYSVFAFPLRDHDMSVQLFNELKCQCDVSFGVMGLGDDIIPNHIQRVDVESTGVSICTSLKFDFVKYIIRRILGRKYYKRPLLFNH